MRLSRTLFALAATACIVVLLAPAVDAKPDSCRRDPTAEGCGTGEDPAPADDAPPERPERILEGNCFFTISGCYPEWAWVGYVLALADRAAP